MKRNINIIALFILMAAGTMELYGQGCPMGKKENCVWGCGRFIDNNNDGYCDFSFVTVPANKETESTLKKDTNHLAKDTSNTQVSVANKPPGTVKGVSSPGAQSNDQKNEGPETPAAIAPEQISHAQVSTGEEFVTPPLATDFNPKFFDPVYDLILVSSLTLGLYLITFILYKRKIIKRIHHRKFWNLMLLLTFIVSCLFGLFLVIQLNYHVAMNSFTTLRFWHVDIGISMALIAIIHILWHLTYFKNMLKKKW